ncbi:MAG: T9SS type A sorting domain-containing protein, partial [Candidatus Eisenbacteria bacterium]|nr:T9SS type A sorting domain-containing protein [Candidatus Eisenbacteria bacterium]
TSWDPQPSWSITELHVDGDLVFVGGGYNTIAGVDRGCISAFDVTTGDLDPWDYDLSALGADDVYSFTVENGMVYVGGRFSSLGDEIQQCIAAVPAPSAPSAVPSAPNGLAASARFRLGSVSPQPATDHAWIQLELLGAETVSATLHDATGRRVREVLHGTLTAGEHSIDLPVVGLPRGLYFLRLQIGVAEARRKLVVIS